MQKQFPDKSKCVLFRKVANIIDRYNGYIINDNFYDNTPFLLYMLLGGSIITMLLTYFVKTFEIFLFMMVFSCCLIISIIGIFIRLYFYSNTAQTMIDYYHNRNIFYGYGDNIYLDSIYKLSNEEWENHKIDLFDNNDKISENEKLRLIIDDLIFKMVIEDNLSDDLINEISKVRSPIS